MRTGTALSASGAARLTGVDKSTITRAVKDGKLSARKDESGRLLIEPAELFRVFDPVPEPDAEPVRSEGSASSRTTLDDASNPLKSNDASTDAASDAHRFRFEAVQRELEEARRE